MTNKSKPNQGGRQLTAAETQARRLAILATELTLAGTQVLVEEFGFSQEMAQRWVEMMIERARKNREG